MSSEYTGKWIVFGAGFLPDASDAQDIYNSGNIPSECPQAPIGMIPFIIKEQAAEEETFTNYANFLLKSGGQGCSLDEDEFDFTVLNISGKKYVLAWICDGSPKYKSGFLNKEPENAPSSGGLMGFIKKLFK